MENINSENKKIVVVDDDPAILEVTRIILEENNYQVITAEDGSIFKELDEKPDLIILDVLLSGADGREIAMELKGDKLMHDIPIVMISAHPGAKQSAKKLGADDFVEKPFDIDNFLSIVDKYVN